MAISLLQIVYFFAVFEAIWRILMCNLAFLVNLDLATLIRKVQPVCAAVFQARGYLSECGCDEFNSVAVRI